MADMHAALLGVNSKMAPDYYLMGFTPMTKGNDYNSSTLRFMKMNSVFDPVRKSDFETMVKEKIRDYIAVTYPGEDVVLTVAPGHKANDASSFMYQLVGEIISENPNLKLTNGSALLVRVNDIPKQATAGGNRSEQTHRDSIIVNVTLGLPIAKGKNVIILDDVWTTGCTLRVCEEKIRTIEPKDVKLLAIGKTI